MPGEIEAHEDVEDEGKDEARWHVSVNLQEHWQDVFKLVVTQEFWSDGIQVIILSAKREDNEPKPTIDKEQCPKGKNTGPPAIKRDPEVVGSRIADNGRGENCPHEEDDPGKIDVPFAIIAEGPLVNDGPPEKSHKERACREDGGRSEKKIQMRHNSTEWTLLRWDVNYECVPRL